MSAHNRIEARLSAEDRRPPEVLDPTIVMLPIGQQAESYAGHVYNLESMHDLKINPLNPYDIKSRTDAATLRKIISSTRAARPDVWRTLLQEAEQPAPTSALWLGGALVPAAIKRLLRRAAKSAGGDATLYVLAADDDTEGTAARLIEDAVGPRGAPRLVTRSLDVAKFDAAGMMETADKIGAPLSLLACDNADPEATHLVLALALMAVAPGGSCIVRIPKLSTASVCTLIWLCCNAFESVVLIELDHVVYMVGRGMIAPYVGEPADSVRAFCRSWTANLSTVPIATIGDKNFTKFLNAVLDFNDRVYAGRLNYVKKVADLFEKLRYQQGARYGIYIEKKVADEFAW